LNFPTIVISLIVFDGDDTLWYGLDGGYISGTDYRDPGRDDFIFHSMDELTIQRNDGQRFRLFPEIPALLPELVRQNVLISLASFNHRQPVLSALKAFGIEHFFQHPTIEWNPQKDKMLKTILRGFSQDGFLVSPETTLFIDDDHRGRYREQMAAIGVHFMQKGTDINDLTQLLSHPRFRLVSAQRSLV
jgi:magnesium-dependent phosphatase-1